MIVAQAGSLPWAPPGRGLQQSPRRVDAQTGMASGSDTRTPADVQRLQEVRAPLDSIVAYVDFLLEEELSDVERRRFLEVVRSSAVRARKLVDGQ
jgi:signal transduction histidine kinase